MKHRFFLSVFSLLLSFAVSPSAYAIEPTPTPTELEKIDTEIDQLKSSLKKLRKEALNKEINSQPFMFDNWDQFAQGIESNEEDEKHILHLKKEIEALIQRREALIQKNSPQ